MLAQAVVDAALDTKALDPVIIDVRGHSSYTDFLVIVSGPSDRHVQSVAAGAVETLKKTEQATVHGIEGLREGRWALVDFGDVVLHVFHQFARDLYELEDLWNHVPQQRGDQAPASKQANA